MLQRLIKRHARLYTSEFSNVDKWTKTYLSHTDPSGCRENKSRFLSVCTCTERLKEHTQAPGSSRCLKRGPGASGDTHRPSVSLHFLSREPCGWDTAQQCTQMCPRAACAGWPQRRAPAVQQEGTAILAGPRSFLCFCPFDLYRFGR